jgi:uncharacterized membrane protein
MQIINNSNGTTGSAINDSGQIAGDVVNSGPAFLYSGGTFSTINPTLGTSQRRRERSNGRCAGKFQWQLTSRCNLLARSAECRIRHGGLDIQPEAINNAGQVVGSATDNNDPISDAVLLSNSQATFLGAPSRAESFANAISDSGAIVGDILLPGQGGYLATVYDPATGWVNLNSLLTN